MNRLHALIAVGLLIQCAAPAVARPGFSLGGKAWLFDTEMGTEVEDPMMGLIAGIQFNERFWLSAMYMSGTVKLEGDRDDSTSPHDSEVFAGYSFDACDVGFGLRFSHWETFLSTGDFEQLNSFGPAIYIGLGDTFGESPLGWYAGSSCMFFDLGDGDPDTGAKMTHISAEGGLFAAWRHGMVTLGYRMKHFLDTDASDYGMAGATGSLSGKF